ncbi:diguanylate cyclase [Sphingomonas naphthae]|uniref:diguanylate cyclase n=1 Tax=Sphingomonas naphthae TaxID=1813468 RepID=A0ABY7TJ77_9SPHN|nr:sensor domain-containing diguanylate cyclase [Sphingomonas naphthae]WCT72777.1 diguanylate cyclase [Sphingomonas naphthae]
MARFTPFAGPMAAAWLYYATALFALLIPVSNDGMTLVWTSNGILIGVVLVADRARRRALLLAGAVGSLAANVQAAGVGLPLSALFTAANLIETIAAVAILDRLFGRRPDFTNMRHIWAFGAVAIVSAVLGASVASLGVPEREFWTSWFLTDALGILIMAPFTVSALTYMARGAQRRLTRDAVEATLMLLFVTAATIASFGQSGLPMLFVPMAALAIATYRLGAFGTVTGLMLIVVIGSIYTALGSGPIATIRADDLVRSVYCQFYVVCCFLATVPMAAKFAAERKLADRLAVSDRAHRNIIDRNSDVIFESDRRGRLTFLNPAWTELTGRPVRDSLGTPAFAFVHIDDQARVFDAEALLRAGKIDELMLEVRLPAVRGAQRWVQIRASLVPSEDGNRQGLFGTVREISDRIRAEQAVAESERRYRLLAENASDTIFCLNDVRGMTYVSPSIEALMGLTAAAAAQPDSGLFAAHPDDAPIVKASLRRLRSGAADREVISFRVRHAIGHWLWIEMSARAARNPVGEIEVIGVARDVSARKQVEEDAIAARMAAEAAARAAMVEADTDELTGLANRRAFLRQLAREIDLSREFGKPLSLAIFDVDHFKKVNDTYGHTVGDVVLRQVAQAALGAVRTGDVVGRIGGEEFAVLMPGAEADHAVTVGERLRLAVAATTTADAEIPTVTVSIGVAAHDGRINSQGLIARADQALYSAKFAGRDQLHLAA